MRGALQHSMPLSGMLELVSAAMSGADPPVTPVPYLVPLPYRHTLAVRRPSSLEEGAFGELREDNLRLILEVGGP